MGVGCLMHLGDEAWELLQGMVDHAPSPRHARRALLMGLQASALKVNKPCPPLKCPAVALLHVLSDPLDITPSLTCTALSCFECAETLNEEFTGPEKASGQHCLSR